MCRGSSGALVAGTRQVAPPAMARKTSFYYSFLVLPSDQRLAIIAVWDFCRAVDDAVDEVDVKSAADRAAVSEGVPKTPQGLRLQPFIGRYDLPRTAFEDVIDGVAMDLDHSRYETFDDLLQ